MIRGLTERKVAGSPLLALILVLGGCAGGRVPAPVVGLQEAPGGEYTVRYGENLYSIAWGLELDYRLLAAWNHLKPPYRLHVGQTLLLQPQRPSVVPTAGGTPASGSVVAALPTPQLHEIPLELDEPKEPVRQPSSTGTVASLPPVSSQPPPPPASKPMEETPIPMEFSQVRALAWGWPIAGGKVVRVDEAGNKIKGIRISGQAGTPVYAAETGVVTYVGPFPGFGNLVIIQHDPRYLTAYGSIERTRVRESSRIEKGSQIAEVAPSGGALYFEIRKDGKPVDPEKLLPSIRR